MDCRSCQKQPGFNPKDMWNSMLDQIIQGLCSFCRTVKSVRRVRDDFGKYSCQECIDKQDKDK
jgi:hypothetical protein